MAKRNADQEMIIDDKLPTKKPRKKTLKSIDGVSQEDFKNTDVKTCSKVLNQHVKTLARMVNADWHDGYEEQDEEMGCYIGTVWPMLEAVRNISVRSQKEFERCHEIIKAIADSWDNMKTIPMRGSVEDSFQRLAEAHDVPVHDGDDMAKEMWPRFLLAAASCDSPEYAVTDNALARFIKDADDFGVDILSAPEDEDEDEDENRDEEQDQKNTIATSVAVSTSSTTAKPTPSSTSTTAKSKGLSRLTAIYGNRSLWSDLPTTRKVHKQKRAIDRRFDGPKNQRTRNFDCDTFF